MWLSPVSIVGAALDFIGPVRLAAFPIHDKIGCYDCGLVLDHESTVFSGYHLQLTRHDKSVTNRSWRESNVLLCGPWT